MFKVSDFMIFAVDVGNTNIVLGGFDNDKLVFESRVATNTSKMSDEYAIAFSDIIALHGCNPKLFDGTIISSVVPQLLPVIKRAVKSLIGSNILVVSPGIKTGLNIKIDNPAILGSDLVCGAVSALCKYSPPCIIIDLGTSTTFSAIDANGSFLGGSICPGVRLSMSALAQNAAQLPYIDLEPCQEIIGPNTIDAIKSGLLYGHAAMLDGLIERYKNVIGENATVIATGGLANSIVSLCKDNIIIDETLVLDGLYQIYKKNS